MPHRDRTFASLEHGTPTVAELARAARFATTLQRVAAALASPLEQRDVLDAIVRVSIAAVHAGAGAVSQLSDDGTTLSLVSSVGYEEELVRRFARLRVSDFPAIGRLVADREPRFIASQEEMEAAAPLVAHHSAPAGARAALPLATSDRLLGILVLTFPEPRDFAPDEREFLVTLARQCAVAMERAQLFMRERAARHAAEAESAQHAGSLERMSDLYFVCDSEWRYRHINRSMRAFLRQNGFEPAALTGRAIWDVFPRLVGGPMYDAMLRARRDGMTVPFAAHGIYADSHYEGHAFPLGSGVGVHVHDLTEQRRAEAEVGRLTTALRRRVGEMETLLAAEHRARSEAEEARAAAERASRSKGDFLAMMSHELRTPLNAIAGYAELIELGLRGPVTDAQVTDLRKIKQNQRHLLGLINAVLNFARLDAGRVLYDLTSVPVAAAVGSVESLIGPQFRERQLQYELSPCEPWVMVRADGEKLQQILLNLLGNATKFTAPGGRVIVTCQVADRQVHIGVRDTGVGIAREQFERIFEPFVQAERSLRSTTEGVGLGLAISRELARGMGGDISLESEVGVGSTFMLTLPRAPDRTPGS